MRELAFGDIHGHAEAFQALLQHLDLEQTDTVILLGDYIDRGPDSCGVIETILDLNRKCTVVALAGNHEKMLLEARSDLESLPDWLRFGGRETLQSYQRHGYSGRISGIPAHHWHFFAEQTLDYWETEESIFVHAAVDPELDMPDQTPDLLFWQRCSKSMAHKSGKRVICGHTSQRSGLPAILDGGLCIDTWVYGGGWLTCFDTTRQMFIQSRSSGEIRSFDLSAHASISGRD